VVTKAYGREPATAGAAGGGGTGRSLAVAVTMEVDGCPWGGQPGLQGWLGGRWAGLLLPGLRGLWLGADKWTKLSAVRAGQDLGGGGEEIGA
jgi:hypothetical protein